MNAMYFTNPLSFLIETVCNLYILAVMLRFLLQWVRAEYYNPISQFLVRITHPPLRLLRRVIPPLGQIDTASLVLLLLLQMSLGFLVQKLNGVSISLAGLLIWSVADLVSLLINIFIFAVIIRAVLSWVNPGTYSSATSLLFSLTEPLLGLVRRLVPPVSGIDLSPLVVLVGLQMLKMLVLPPLLEAARLFA